MVHRILLSSERPDPDTPSAQEAYRALREDPTGEPGKRIKVVLERLRDNPGQVRAHSRAYRPGTWWAAEIEMPDEPLWWIIWRLDAEAGAVHVRWIGPEPAGHL